MATRVRVSKIEVPGPPHGFTRTTSGLDIPEHAGSQLPVKPKFSDPESGQQLKRMAVNNLVGVSDAGTKQEHEEGRVWYPKVNDATSKGVKKHKLDSVLHGAGVVAGVSPNMDWENSNIDAFDHMSKLKANPAHMAVMQRSLNNVVPVAGKPGQYRQQRTPEFADVLTKHYPSLAKAPDSNIHKASRIWDGEHPDSVLDPTSAFKTNSFAHNIADPSRKLSPHGTGVPLATIDGRSNDIASNNLMSWKTDRGIGNGVLKVKKDGTRPLTRAEHFADAHGMAAEVLSGDEGRDITAGEVQARTWTTAKRMEKQMPGARRSKATREVIGGPPRRGQRYLS